MARVLRILSCLSIMVVLGCTTGGNRDWHFSSRKPTASGFIKTQYAEVLALGISEQLLAILKKDFENAPPDVQTSVYAFEVGDAHDMAFRYVDERLAYCDADAGDYASRADDYFEAQHDGKGGWVIKPMKYRIVISPRHRLPPGILRHFMTHAYLASKKIALEKFAAISGEYYVYEGHQRWIWCSCWKMSPLSASGYGGYGIKRLGMLHLQDAASPIEEVANLATAVHCLVLGLEDPLTGEAPFAGVESLMELESREKLNAKIEEAYRLGVISGTERAAVLDFIQKQQK